jgi:hypothetical protein
MLHDCSYCIVYKSLVFTALSIIPRMVHNKVQQYFDKCTLPRHAL